MHTTFDFRAQPLIRLDAPQDPVREPPAIMPVDFGPFVFGLQNMTIKDASDDMRKKLRLLRLNTRALDDREIVNTPIFTEAVRRHVNAHIFSQHGLLGGEVAKLRQLGSDSSGSLFAPDDAPIRPEDAPFLHYNVTAPSSTFICGSQGSGKSHTLSCLLENCLLASDANTLPNPLTGVVFHYDAFSSDESGQPCEAAHLSSNPDVSVRVLCAPTNVAQIRSTYAHLKNVHVQELRLSERNLNTRRMLDLMAVSSIQGGGMPLYFHVLTRILKEMRIQQQQTGGGFNYRAFKQALASEKFSKDQNGPLMQRLETLESFMAREHVGPGPGSHGSYGIGSTRGRNGVAGESTATQWEGKPGQLTIVDLSCPCMTAESACALFNICLSLFLEQNTKTGRVVALDEAHKYMTDSTESQALTESLLATIRLQRHLGARVIIATQEPTISPKLLDLCSVTLVHRFTSPDWLQSLKRHLAAAAQPGLTARAASSSSSSQSSEQGALAEGRDTLSALFARIVVLRQGEALLFCPSALVGVVKGADAPGADSDGLADWAESWSGGGAHEAGRVLLEDGSGNHLVRLGCGVMHIRVRERVTEDGGKSIMAG
ncbi:hypothetical protein E4U42_000362 [Claviceps africana]|uniref:P-loop containing nucleoside triphosphate hydrolase protein n=1 Tax=Claviceps africana TaxID=83212 RepID=A0A8K0NEQ7_9HYPO|nr:hypothetical protein E4U42_000362 [Claviceps africana]